MAKAEKVLELLKVFKPYPLKDKEFDDFYVDTSSARGYDSTYSLIDHFELFREDPQKLLFMGHSGSGKSTELWKVKKALEDRFKIISFSVREEINLSDMNYIDLLFVILDKLFHTAVEIVKIDPHVLDNIYEYWKDDRFIEDIQFTRSSVEEDGQLKINFLQAISLHIKGILSVGKETKVVVRKKIEPTLNQLIRNINDLVKDIRRSLSAQGKVPIIIIEDLDKLEIEIAEDLFLNHRKTISTLDVHIIFTFPIFLYYSGRFNEIKDDFDHYELLSMIKTHNKDNTIHVDGRAVIRSVIEKRANTSLFGEGVMEYIIEKSGGVLRDVFEMIENAARRARRKNRDTEQISREDASEAYLMLKSGYERGIKERHINQLKSLYEDPIKKPIDDNESALMELLRGLSVIEYNCERWCGIHPAIIEFLREKGEI
jgi:energy-coupling factor transporter ATP-binding protein EcfA2